MKNIYEELQQASGSIQGYAVMKDAEFVAKIIFKRSASGLRVTCYAHVIGLPMVKGIANGGNYDKRSAACCSAFDKVMSGAPDDTTLNAVRQAVLMRDALTSDGGSGHWDNVLRKAGYNVHQIV